MEEVAKFISNLLNSRQQSQVYHWQAVGEGSNAVHEALNEYYDKIIKKVDGLVESIQGRNGIIRGYNLEFAVREDNKPLIYFQALVKYVEVVRQRLPQDSYIQNQIDEIVDLLETTKYKLQNLR
jgi:DNA-binding ferritin-like protein